MSRKYFGTDGVRGRVGVYPMTAEFVMRLGWAAGRVLCPEGGGSVVIGKDTRISGYMLESALEAGFSAAGVGTRMLGPMPTPAIAYLATTFRATAGVVISASHNAYYDNGVKFFGPDGMKLTDAQEEEIEAMVDRPMETMPSEKLGKAYRVEDARGRYIEFCKSTFPNRLTLHGLKIVLDCANGAAYQVAPSIFRELGAVVTVIGDDPDGININAECGSTHPQRLQAAVQAQGADMGIALDGDADRVLVVDDAGNLIDGDQLLYVAAMARFDQNRLRGPVVGTVMTNLGLQRVLQEKGIEFMRAKVGDRYIMELLRKHGGELGGETSGHMLCLDKASTGDGIVSALEVLTAVVGGDKSLAELVQGMPKYPQVMINVPLGARVNVGENAQIIAAVAEVEGELGEAGRVVLRPSGTEPVVRVMVEGQDAAVIQAKAESLAEVVRHAA